MRPFLVLICSFALVWVASGATESKKETSHTKSSQHAATHAEHPAGGVQHPQAPQHPPGGSTYIEHPQPPQHPGTTGGHPPSGGTGNRPAQPENHPPETAPAGNAAAKPAAPAPPPPVYHYNFPTKSGLIGRDFTRPLTPGEQSAIAREVEKGQPQGTKGAPGGYQYDNGVYHYNFPTKSGLIGRDFTKPLTPEEQSAIARQIEKGQEEGTQVRSGAGGSQIGVHPFPSRHFDLPKTPPGTENVKFQSGRHIPECENWRDSRYNAFRNYAATWHDAVWWRAHHRRIVFVLGGWYYRHANYWYPAWGYQPEAVYGYDGPIYAFNDLEPDQVVANVQATLQQFGYYHGPINGELDPATQDAIANYQRDHGLYATSAIDEPTLASLGMA